MKKSWILYLTALAGTLGFYAAYQGWLAWLLLQAVFWLPALSLAVSLPAMLTTRIHCDCPGYLPLGSDRKLSARIHCPLPTPPVRFQITAVRPLTAEAWLLKDGNFLPTDHVGRLDCRRKGCRVYDYLGFFGIPEKNRSEMHIFIRPVPVSMPEPASLQRHFSTAWRPKAGGGFAENHELRLYRPGDNMNQIHWKLTAKTDQLMIREPMVPLRSRAVVSVTVNGNLNRRLGQLLWLGRYLLDRSLPFTLWALTGEGAVTAPITNETELLAALDLLLSTPRAAEDSVFDRSFGSAWHYHIGGDDHEN